MLFLPFVLTKKKAIILSLPVIESLTTWFVSRMGFKQIISGLKLYKLVLRLIRILRLV